MALTRHKSIPPSLLAIAARQHDLLRIGQLRAGGVSQKAIAALLRAGALHKIHRGVYKVGTPRLSRHARWLAAVYAAGPGSALSHRDGGELQRLAIRGLRDSVDVTTQRSRAGHPGINLRRVRHLHPEDITTVRGIPATTVARTLVDLADVLSAHELRRVVHEAEVQGLLDLPSLDAATRRAAGRDTSAIRAVLASYRPRPKKDIEDRLEAIADRAGLRDPVRNMTTEVDGIPFELDRYYPDLRLCLEADGYGVHKTRQKFNADRRKDRILKLRAGITVLRYTWEDVTARAAEAEAELAGATPPPHWARPGASPTA
jgi:hypothetical protein